MNAHLGAQLLVSVTVNFDQFYSASFAGYHIFDDWPQGPARAAPTGPKIDQNRRGMAGFNHIGHEAVRITVFNQLSVGRAVRGG